MERLKKVVVLGHGTVGSGVVELVERNKEYLMDKYQQEFAITGILVRNLEKHLGKGKDHLLTDSFENLLEQKPDIAVEVMGGIQPARTYVKTLLDLGVSVVTANKDLIAEHGLELLQAAQAGGAVLHFEASVGGGIPVIKPFRESLKGNRIRSIIGIMNGTTNFILSKMYDEDLSYGESLRLAQDAGFAEADPTSDVKGYDAARKLAILSSIAFDKAISWQHMGCEGVQDVQPFDVANARAVHCKIKLLAIALRSGHNIHCSVRPALVDKHSFLGHIDGENNAIEIEGDAVGKVMFTGAGAGKLPTASAVYGDLLDVLSEKANGILPLNSDVDYQLIPYYNAPTQWLVRLRVNHIQDTVDLILSSFSDHSLQLHHLNSKDNLFFLVDTEDERQLLQKLAPLQGSSSVEELRHFLIYR